MVEGKKVQSYLSSTRKTRFITQDKQSHFSRGARSSKMFQPSTSSTYKTAAKSKKLSKAERVALRAQNQGRRSDFYAPILKHPDDGRFGDHLINQSRYTVESAPVLVFSPNDSHAIFITFAYRQIAIGLNCKISPWIWKEKKCSFGDGQIQSGQRAVECFC